MTSPEKTTPAKRKADQIEPTRRATPNRAAKRPNKDSDTASKSTTDITAGDLVPATRKKKNPEDPDTPPDMNNVNTPLPQATAPMAIDDTVNTTAATQLPAQQPTAQPQAPAHPNRGLDASTHAPTRPPGASTQTANVHSAGLSEVLWSFSATEAENRGATTKETPQPAEMSTTEELPYPLCSSWPPIHINRPCQRLGHINKMQLKSLIDSGEDFLLISVWDEHVTADVSEKTSQTIADTIYALRGEVPVVHIPSTSAAAGTDEAPVSYIVGDLSEPTRAFLLNQFCFSFADITFFVHRMGVELPLWVCALRGLWTFKLEVIQAEIAQGLYGDPTFRSLIEEFRPNNARLAELELDDAIKSVVDSVDVQLLKDKRDAKTNDWKVNLYIQPPTSDISESAKLLDFLRKRSYRVQGCGTGTPWEPITCTGCHGVDHMRGLCPFADVPGWRGRKTLREINIENRIARQNAKTKTFWEDFKPNNNRGGFSSRGRGRGGRRGRQSGRDFT